jgi:hypothetical protein
MSSSDLHGEGLRRYQFRGLQAAVLTEYNESWRGRVDMDDDDHYRDFVVAVRCLVNQSGDERLGELASCSNFPAMVSLAVGTLVKRGLIDPSESFL